MQTSKRIDTSAFMHSTEVLSPRRDYRLHFPPLHVCGNSLSVPLLSTIRLPAPSSDNKKRTSQRLPFRPARGADFPAKFSQTIRADLPQCRLSRTSLIGNLCHPQHSPAGACYIFFSVDRELREFPKNNTPKHSTF